MIYKKGPPFRIRPVDEICEDIRRARQDYGGTIKTLAGTFHGTTKASGEVSFLGKKYTSDSWMHPAVPINGMVKSVTAEEGQTIELLDFGLSGAKRSF